MSQYDVRLADDVGARGVRRPDAAARLLLPVADALVVLHARGASHGAVSPQAVAIDDAGLGVLIDRDRLSPDPVYMAPPRRAPTGSAAADDVWSFAAVLTFTITGQPPRNGRQPAQYTGWLAPITELALVSDPDARPNMADVADYLRARVAPPSTPNSGRTSGARLALVGAAVIALLGVLGAWLLFGGDDADPRAGQPRVADEPSGAPPTPRPSSEPTTSSTPDPERPSAADLKRFARSYVATASRNPAAGFALLTEDYQAASPRYREVWTAISDPEILSISADADRSTVTYTYRYDLPGGRQRTEVVTLRLVERAGDLLIAGASSRPR